MAATKFTEAEREKLFAQLEAPFDPALVKWRVMRTFDYGRSASRSHRSLNWAGGAPISAKIMIDD